MSDTNNKVSKEHWLFLVGLVAFVWVLGQLWADKAGADYDRAIVSNIWTYDYERGDRGRLAKNTAVCQVTWIGPETVKMVEDQHRIDALVRAGSVLTLSPEDYTRGAELYFGKCGSLAQAYRVLIYKVDGDYALMVFEAQYGFTSEFYIIRLPDFKPDGTVEL